MSKIVPDYILNCKYFFSQFVRNIQSFRDYWGKNLHILREKPILLRVTWTLKTEYENFNLIERSQTCRRHTWITDCRMYLVPVLINQWTREKNICKWAHNATRLREKVWLRYKVIYGCRSFFVQSNTQREISWLKSFASMVIESNPYTIICQ